MDSRLLTRENSTTGVHLEAVNVAGLDDVALDLRLCQIGRARNQLDGFLAEAVAEKKRRTTPYDTAHALKSQLRQSGQQAQRTMREADQLEELSITRGALTDSRITSEHARILGTAAQSGPLNEHKMVTAAETQTPEQLRRTVREHQDELAGGDMVAKRLERQQRARMASFTEQDDGMWRLFALFDPVTAQGIRAALNHKTDMAWHATTGRERLKARHRRADAIAELLTRTGNGDSEQPQPTTLLILADYDAIDKQLDNPRLADGTPLPQDQFRKLACNAEILTGIFDADLQCLSLGHQRHPSPQLRAAITARDQGCIGCRAEPEWCVSHHIIEWQHDGLTQPDNLVLLCHDCHVKVHHRDYTVEHHPDIGRPYLRPPWQKPPEPPLRR
ncbi:MAG: DUF222 domain-containing protein [Acidimicrobiia bacterium]|nr:DUF222 domain-containing protein [Acidimicrobiia bacterium]MYC57723.1 DUF222 domain-containing protein [Acidimicrobiia bacterium]MYG94630.1 DUF222 domain-containing protein [Acidimicrobiia bacterium]MYI30922.1 DUF222 domain-containing protein [Acidimicrobiia bacterium]